MKLLAVMLMSSWSLATQESTPYRLSERNAEAAMTTVMLREPPMSIPENVSTVMLDCITFTST